MKHSKPFFDTLLKLNQLTNDTEMELRKANAAKNKALVSKLEDVFVSLKRYMASCIDYFYPKMNYSSLEAVTYSQEMIEKNITDGNYWGYKIVDILHNKVQSSSEQGIINGTLNVDENGKMQLVDQEGNFLKEMTMEELPEDMQQYIKDVQEKIKNDSFGEDDSKNIFEIIEEYVPSAEEKTGFAGLVKMDSLKQTLMKRVVEPLRDTEKAKQKENDYGIKLMPTGMLLYGPPGCGKTTIAKRLSVEANVPLFMMKAGKFGTSYYHETSKNLTKAYDYAKEIATSEKPVLMLFDDCDSIFSARTGGMERFETEELNTLLDLIDDASKHNVITIGTTNRFDIMDEAVKRRLSLQVQIPLADLETRTALIDRTLDSPKGQKLRNNKEAVNLIAQKFDGYSNDTIIKTIKEALTAVCDESDGQREITLDDVLKIMETDEFKNKKVDAKLYETKNSRKSIGFTNSSSNISIRNPKDLI